MKNNPLFASSSSILNLYFYYPISLNISQFLLSFKEAIFVFIDFYQFVLSSVLFTSDLNFVLIPRDLKLAQSFYSSRSYEEILCSCFFFVFLDKCLKCKFSFSHYISEHLLCRVFNLKYYLIPF
jgi:hypothetical protein